jgi:intein/homing endonuclease
MSDILDDNIIIEDEEGFAIEVEDTTTVIFTEEQEKEIMEYLQAEIRDVEEGDERVEFLDRVNKWRRQREAQPEEKIKNYPWKNACFHEDVEILSDKGWKLVKDIQRGDKVLSREPLTGKASFKEVTETFEYNAPKEGLIRMKNLFFDIQVTDNHRFLLESRNGNTTKIVTAKEALEGFKGQGNNMVPLVCEVEEEPVISFFGYNSEDFLSFAGWYISEGWAYKHKCLGIAQSRDVNPENVSEIKLLLNKLDWDYSYNGSSFLINVDKAVVNFFKPLGRSWEKYIPRMLLETSKEQLQFLYNSLIKGDGCESWAKDKHRNYPRTSYYTVSEQLADDVQELAIRLGISASITKREPVEGGKIKGRRITGKRTGYTVGMRYTKQSRLRHDRCLFEYVPYEGKVYCVEVPEDHTIYVRQNGLPLWTMNSNVTVPIAMTNANGIFALLKSTFSRRVPFWSVLVDDPNLADQAEALEELLSTLAESSNHMNIRKKNSNILYDLASLGTEFVKIPWTIKKSNIKRRNPETGATETITKTVKNTPDLIPIRLEDFLTRPYWGSDIQRAPWIAHKIHFMKHELKERDKSGIFSNVDVVLNGPFNEIDENRQDSLERGGTDFNKTSEASVFDIYEVYFYWDIDGNGIEEDMIAWIDPISGTFLRVEYNSLGIRPIVRMPYFERPDELYAIGTGWMVENLQDEIDALHNMRIDGTHISMLQMFVSRRGSGLGPNEEFRPLKHIIVDNPLEDFMTIKFPDLGYGTLQAELMTKEYADRVTGSADAMMGFESKSAGTRATSSGTQFLAQQGSRIFTAISESVEDAYSEIGQIVVFQIIKNKNLIIDELDKLVSPEHIEPLIEVLNMDVEDIPTTFKFKVETTQAEKTEDVRRQSILTLFQLYSMGGEKLIQLAAMIFNPQVQLPPEAKEAAMKFYIGGTKMLDDIMKFFGEDDRRAYLPYIKNLEFMTTALENMKDEKLEFAKKQMKQQGQLGGQFGGQ